MCFAASKIPLMPTTLCLKKKTDSFTKMSDSGFNIEQSWSSNDKGIIELGCHKIA